MAGFERQANGEAETVTAERLALIAREAPDTRRALSAILRRGLALRERSHGETRADYVLTGGRIRDGRAVYAHGRTDEARAAFIRRADALAAAGVTVHFAAGSERLAVWLSFERGGRGTVSLIADTAPGASRGFSGATIADVLRAASDGGAFAAVEMIADAATAAGVPDLPRVTRAYGIGAVLTDAYRAAAAVGAFLTSGADAIATAAAAEHGYGIAREPARDTDGPTYTATRYGVPMRGAAAYVDRRGAIIEALLGAYSRAERDNDTAAVTAALALIHPAAMDEPCDCGGSAPYPHEPGADGCETDAAGNLRAWTWTVWHRRAFADREAFLGFVHEAETYADALAVARERYADATTCGAGLVLRHGEPETAPTVGAYISETDADAMAGAIYYGDAEHEHEAETAPDALADVREHGGRAAELTAAAVDCVRTRGYGGAAARIAAARGRLALADVAAREARGISHGETREAETAGDGAYAPGAGWDGETSGAVALTNAQRRTVESLADALAIQWREPLTAALVPVRTMARVPGDRGDVLAILTAEGNPAPDAVTAVYSILTGRRLAVSDDASYADALAACGGPRLAAVVRESSALYRVAVGGAYESLENERR